MKRDFLLPVGLCLSGHILRSASRNVVPKFLLTAFAFECYLLPNNFTLWGRSGCRPAISQKT